MRRQGLYYTQAAVVLLAITSNTDWLDNTLFAQQTGPTTGVGSQRQARRFGDESRADNNRRRRTAASTGTSN